MSEPADQAATQMQISGRLLLEHTTGFIHHLRLNNFALGPAETRLAIRIMSDGLTSASETMRKLKIALCGRTDDWNKFDDLFEAYWFTKGKERTVLEQGRMNQEKPLPINWQQHFDNEGNEEGDEKGNSPQIESDGEQDSDGDAAGRLIATKRDVNLKTDFRSFVQPNEIKEIEDFAYRLARQMKYRLSRRYRQSKKGQQIDIRHSIRKNMGHGGDLIELKKKKTVDRPIELLLFLDVSGSMKHYSRFFLQFLRGLVGQWAHTDAYLFHTRLVRVTDTLKDKDAMKAMARLSLMASGFGGGTKLGESLKNFNKLYAKTHINSRTIVIMMSDGYDTGAPDLLAQQLVQLKKRASKLIWLNPLLGWEQYEPVTEAMTKALPHIDFFAAANTLESLKNIEPELVRV